MRRATLDRVGSSAQAVAGLRESIKQLRPCADEPPTQVGKFWDDVVRWTLDAWATGLERDMLMPGAQYCTRIGQRKVHHSPPALI